MANLKIDRRLAHWDLPGQAVAGSPGNCSLEERSLAHQADSVDKMGWVDMLAVVEAIDDFVPEGRAVESNLADEEAHILVVSSLEVLEGR